MENIFMCLIIAGVVVFGFFVSGLLDRCLGRKDDCSNKGKHFH